MRGNDRRSFTIAAFAAAFALGLGLDAGQAAAQPIFVACSNTNFGTVVLDNQFGGGSGPLTFVVQGTCFVNAIITRDDVTITTDGVTPATLIAADPNQATIKLDGARRLVIDGKFANGLTVNGGRRGVFVTRGGSADLRNCHVNGASLTGIASAHTSSVTVDACLVDGNENGVTSAASSSVVVTNSTVSGNVENGLVATRNAYIRVGQDLEVNPIVRPVVVSGNGATGIVITEGSAGNVVGGTVEGNGGSNIFVGRASSGQIGVGINDLTGGVTIQNAASNGVTVEGGNATIVLSTITGNDNRGITVSNGGTARIGLMNVNNAFGANTISHNGNDGIGVFHSSSAFIGGNTIDANTNFGINVGQASATLVGGNTITNNTQTGVFVRAGAATIGDPGFGAATTVNTISGNGGTGPNRGGVFAFHGGDIRVENATISNNTGTAVQAFMSASIDILGTTSVTVPAGGATAGALAQFGSTFRVRDTASIVSATFHGIQASNNSSVNVVNAGNIVQGNGLGAFGVQCFNSIAVPSSAATLTGNLAGVTGTAGSIFGCNVYP